MLRSKAPVTVEEYGSRYACIGPYNPDTAPTEFEPIAAGPLTAPVIDVMKQKYGIIVHFGKWLVEGYPKTFLIDLNCSMDNLDMWRHELMPGFEAPGDQESNDSIVFGYQTGLFLKEFALANKAIKVIAHFHEVSTFSTFFPKLHSLLPHLPHKLLTLALTRLPPPPSFTPTLFSVVPSFLYSANNF